MKVPSIKPRYPDIALLSDEMVDLGDGRGERPLSDILTEADAEIAAGERMKNYVEEGRNNEH